MLKMKLGDRISVGYALLFLMLMIFLNTTLIYILKRQDSKILENEIELKVKEIDDFFDKISVFSDKYEQLTLEFNPKLEGQKVTYEKPFNPGKENYLYLLRIKNNTTDTVPLNTLNSADIDISSTEGKDIINTIENSKIKSNEKGKIIKLIDNNTYYIRKVSREIKGNEFSVYILEDISQENKIYKKLILLAISTTILGLILILIISKWFTKRILRPVKNVIQTAKTISTDDMDKRIEVPKVRDELQELALIFNRMLERLELSFENQKKFVSDASHELRTPLAIIKGYAEIIKKRRLMDEELFEECIDSIINETENMKNLIRKLLFLAKGEVTKINMSFSNINMEEFIQHVYSDTEVSVKTHKLLLVKSENYEVNGDRSLLLQAIRALIENATKYSDDGTTILISSSIENSDKARITIKDEGVGISEEDIKKIFERFYRVDESRTKSTGGSGLGLAIVKQIVKIHNGEIEVKSELGKGTEISILLPLLKIENNSL